MTARQIGKLALLPAAAFGVAGLALAMPSAALEASLRGVAIWWDVLFPALFPFFVLSELMLGFGVVHFAGTLLDPLMRSLFRIPGLGGFVLAMGFVSGYPVGARMTSRLMEQRLLDREQGERLVVMTTTADPLFLIGAVCVGFFGIKEAAPLLVCAHYGGALLIGLPVRHWIGHGTRRRNRQRAGMSDTKPGRLSGERSGNPTVASRASFGIGRLKEAVRAMHQARLEDGRPAGVMLADALRSSIRLMIVVGGLVVFFSSALSLLLESGLLRWLQDRTGEALQALGLSGALASALTQGALEVTLGAKAAASDASVPLADRLAAAAFVLSWAGFSVHAQVAGLMSRTEWRYAPFVRARLLHAVVSSLLVYALWPFLGVSH
ncbi:MAG TPA: nucleoside recognition domain-containing protein [Paenibacillaceae bacterium]